MFLPIFIAFLMGLISPSSTNQTCNSGSTVYVTTGEPDPTDPGDGGDNGEDEGTDGPGTGGPSGNTGNPPPKP